MAFLQSLKLDGFLSFPPRCEAIPLTPLNVLIGPNGAGKSNLLEALEVLRATPTALAAFVREGGTAQEWLWKGDPTTNKASVEAVITRAPKMASLRYRLCFAPAAQRMEVLDEVIEETSKRSPIYQDVLFYYRFQNGKPVLNVLAANSSSPKKSILDYTPRRLERQSLIPDESVLSQRKDPDQYPEVTWLGKQFSKIQTFRDWTFGRSAPLRKPQRGDLPIDELLPDSDNLGLILNELEHTDASAEFNRLLSRFLPRYQRFSTRIQGNTVQLYLHEQGLRSPLPATRLSDGTIRFMTMLALLLSPIPPPLLCMEEPELGLHPDAVILLADLLAEASSRTQLIVTTHSDALVSALTDHADSVLVCENLGGTTLRRVDAKRIAHLLDRYRLGEIWTMGELGGNP
jgi:predicted ATPase